MGKLLKKRPISIGFVFTNYNNSLLTIQAIDSIKKSAKNIEYYSVIVDNFSRKKETELLKDVNKIDTNTHIIFNCSNVGYFKGLNLGIAFLKDRYINLDYIVAGNNDLVFKDDFFIQLEKNANLLNEYPVISPDLITLDGVHQNPHVIKGFSRLREIIWDVYFVNYWVSIIISKISSMGKSFFERKDYRSCKEPMLISQGYGACYILTKKFFLHFDEFWSPNFLMGEEFFLSKQLESKGFQFFYYPGIVVHHHDHATVSKIPSKKLWIYSREYHRIYRKFVSPYRIKMDNARNFNEIK